MKINGILAAFAATSALMAVWVTASAVPLVLDTDNTRSSSGTLSFLVFKTCAPAIGNGCLDPANSWVVANGVVGSNATWNWDGLTLTASGTFQSTSFLSSNPSGSSVISDKTVSLVIDTVTLTTTATSYNCVEGTFLINVGANGCANTSTGVNTVNDSSVLYNVGADANCVQRTIGGDDTSSGNPRGMSTLVAAGSCDATAGAYPMYTIVSDDTATGGTLVLSNGIPIGTAGTHYFTFSVADTVPDAFTFTDLTDQALNSPITSNAITVAGINAPAVISVVGGEYAIDGGAFTAVAGTVSVGQTVTARVTSSATPATATNATVTIGGVADTFTVTTVPADTTPTAFSFTDQTDVALSTPITSNAITVAGINAPAVISVVGGEYAINGGAFTAVDGTVSNGNTVTVRQTSSPTTLTATNATVTIGGVADTFTVTTGDEVLVIDGGSSALDPLSLAFLGGLPLLRRRRKAALKLAVATVAVAVSVLAGPTQAADNDRWDWDYDGLYLGAGVNGTSLQTSDSFNSSLQEELDLPGVESSGNFEDFPVGGQVYAGWMFNRYWGLEGRWSGTADGESDILTENTTTGDRTKIGDIKASLDGVTAYGVANWPVAQRWDLFGKLGYTWQNADLKANGPDGSFSSSESDNGVAGALGGRWRFAHHWATTLEGEYLGVDFNSTFDDPWRASLNVEYWFGGHELAPPPPPPARVAAVQPPPPPPAAPKDSDGDGVVDGQDQCPETPRGDRVGSAGCSCDVTRQLQFKSGSAELTDADKLVLDEMAENLTRLHFVSGTIEGYTDSVGSDAYNQGLSERRAKTVADYLQAKGISGDRMQVVGHGESDPIGDNKTAEGRALNRRVVAKRTDCEK